MKEIIKLQQHQHASLVEIEFSCGFNTMISYELLRVYSTNDSSLTRPNPRSPLITDKAFVKLIDCDYLPRCAKFIFNDSMVCFSITSEYLYNLCQRQDQLWLDYLKRCATAQQSKMQPIAIAQV